jgi:hypothetical protein
MRDDETLNQGRDCRIKGKGELRLSYICFEKKDHIRKKSYVSSGDKDQEQIKKWPSEY